jgi:hypothetical protein
MCVYVYCMFSPLVFFLMGGIDFQCYVIQTAASRGSHVAGGADLFCAFCRYILFTLCFVNLLLWVFFPSHFLSYPYYEYKRWFPCECCGLAPGVNNK